MDYHGHLDGIDLEDAPAPTYAGIRTFLRSETADPGELTDDVDVAALGIPFDGGQGKRAGARLGPSAIREASLLYAHRNIYDMVNVETDRAVRYDDLAVRDCGDVPVTPTSIQHTRAMAEAYVEEVSDRAFPVVLGGDHYVTLPAFMGYARSVDGPVGIVHLDAHSDTVSSSRLFGTHWNGTEFPRIHETAHSDWSNHAMIGIRGHEDRAFHDLIEEDDLHVSFHTDVREDGIERCTERAIEHATDGVDHVYVTLDIDVVTPSSAPGTGSPEPGGITSDQLFRAMDLIGACDAVGALDVVEVAPQYDPTITTQQIAARAIMRLLEARFF